MCKLEAKPYRSLKHSFSTILVDNIGTNKKKIKEKMWNKKVKAVGYIEKLTRLV